MLTLYKAYDMSSSREEVEVMNRHPTIIPRMMKEKATTAATCQAMVRATDQATREVARTIRVNFGESIDWVLRLLR